MKSAFAALAQANTASSSGSRHTLLVKTGACTARNTSRIRLKMAPGHKMLHTIYAMLSKNTHYVDKTVDFEALMVARNAPRWMKTLVKHGFVPTPA